MSAPRTTIVSVDELAAHPEWRIFDCSHSLTDPEAGAQAYAAGHIPGALHARMEAVLSGERTGRNGRNPLPCPDAFARWLGAMGIGPDDQVICYDRAGNTAAARLWWMLRWVGHGPVAVLDGAMQAWTASGRPLDTGVPVPEPRSYEARTDDGRHVDVSVLEDNLDHGQLLVVDARGAEKFAGVNETVDARGGHIPGAVNRPYQSNLDPEGLFKEPAELRAEWTALLDGHAPGTLVASCGSGVSACHNLLALEIAGVAGARLYPGSWSEWCSDPARPIET